MRDLDSINGIWRLKRNGVKYSPLPSMMIVGSCGGQLEPQLWESDPCPMNGPNSML